MTRNISNLIQRTTKKLCGLERNNNYYNSIGIQFHSLRNRTTCTFGKDIYSKGFNCERIVVDFANMILQLYIIIK